MLSPSVTAQHARVSLAPVARHLQLHLHAVVDELREMLRACATCDPVPATKPRANTSPGKGSSASSNSDSAWLAIAAVFDIDPFGMVDIDAQRPATLPGHELDFDEFVPDSFKTGSNRAMRRSCSAVSTRPSNKKGPQRPSRDTRRTQNVRRSKKTKAPSGPSTSLGILAGQAALPHRGRGLYGTKSVVDRPWLIQVPCVPKVAVSNHGHH